MIPLPIARKENQELREQIKELGQEIAQLQIKKEKIEQKNEELEQKVETLKGEVDDLKIENEKERLLLLAYGLSSLFLFIILSFWNMRNGMAFTNDLFEKIGDVDDGIWMKDEFGS